VSRHHESRLGWQGLPVLLRFWLWSLRLPVHRFAPRKLARKTPHRLKCDRTAIRME